MIDPVDRANNVARAISRENLSHLSTVLKNGKQCLIHALQRASQSLEMVGGDDSITNSVELILRSMFPVSHIKFRRSRPDLLVHPRQRMHRVRSDNADLRNIILSHQKLGEANRDYSVLRGNFPCLRGTFEYAKLIAGTSWTEETLRSVLLQMIRSKPADLVLPVGEIGKMLQSKTRNPLISSEIKERFGGLKKFLGDCEGIIVHNDHPFNPSVSVDEDIFNKLQSSGSLNGIRVGVALTQGLANSRGYPGFGSSRSRKKRSNRKKRNRGNKHVLASAPVEVDETQSNVSEDEKIEETDIGSLRNIDATEIIANEEPTPLDRVQRKAAKQLTTHAD